MMDSSSSLWQSQDSDPDGPVVQIASRERDARASTSGFADISWLTYITVVIFGIGSWITINGIYVELPEIIKHAPEGRRLPSYITVATQLANVAPLLYCISRKVCPYVVNERSAVYASVLVGCLACALLAFFWDRTSVVLGSNYSASLIVLTFILAMTDCTSSVVFLPFMALYPKIYLSALYVGESSSGLLPGLVALAQNVDHKVTPYHNVTTPVGRNGTHHSYYTGLAFQPVWFFMFLFVMMLCCGIAFLLLNFHPRITRTQTHFSSRHNGAVSRDGRPTVGRVTPNTAGNSRYRNMMSTVDSDDSMEESPLLPVHIFDHRRHQTLLIVYLGILIWINCLNTGIFSQLQPFACSAYGPTVYHLASTLSAVAAAITSFLYIWFPTRSLTAVVIFTVLHSGTAGYVTLLAAQNPNPLLKGHTAGMVLAIMAFIWSGILFSYIKLAICSLLSDVGRKGLLWCGISIQVGSFLGAILMFIIINNTDIFQ